MVTPVKSLSLPLKYLRDTIAASATFQAWVSAADAAAALASVYYFEAAGSVDLPLAIVEWEGGLSWDKHAGGSRGYFETEGSLAIDFHAAIASGADAEDAGLAFGNSLGAIIDEMLELAGVAGYLDIERAELPESPQRGSVRNENAQDIGAVYSARVIVTYKGVA